MRTGDLRPWWRFGLNGLRTAMVCGGLLTAIGVAGWLSHQMLLAAALGPTAYVLIVHRGTASARARNATIGHLVAIASSLACLALFGLWSHPSVAETHQESLSQSGAQGLAISLTVLILALLKIHHAPAAATALLVSSGISRPGAPLLGLVIGLAAVIVLAPLLSQLTGHHPNGDEPDG
jgi:hypothetical protein